MVIYDPDSDDSSSDGYGDNHKVSMNIANMKCGDSDDGFSISSDLLERIDDEEYDDPMLYANKYNPLNLRVEAGKRVGMDTDDESDGDGEHGGYHVDKSYGRPSAKDMRGGDMDEHSIGSDDDFMITTIPTTFTRTEKEFDDNIPTGNDKEETTGGAGHHADEFAVEGETKEEHGERYQRVKGAKREEMEGKYKESERAGKTAVAKAESKRLVADALAKARASRDPTERARQLRMAKEYGKGKLVSTGKFVEEQGQRVELKERLGKVGVVSPELASKGAKALQEVVRKARQTTTLKGQGEVAQAVRKAVTTKQKKEVVASIKGAGRESAEGGQVSKSAKLSSGAVAVSTKGGKPVSALVSKLSPSVALEKLADRAKKYLEEGRAEKGRGTFLKKLREQSAFNAKDKELQAKAVAFMKARTLKTLRQAPQKRRDLLAQDLLRQAISQKIVGRRITSWARGILAQAEFSREEQSGIRQAIATAMLKKPVDEDEEEPAPVASGGGGGGSVRPSEPAVSVAQKGKAVEIGKEAGVSFEGKPVFLKTTAGGSRKLVVGGETITQTGANVARLEALQKSLAKTTKDPVTLALRSIVDGMVYKARQNAKKSKA